MKELMGKAVLILATDDASYRNPMMVPLKKSIRRHSEELEESDKAVTLKNQCYR